MKKIILNIGELMIARDPIVLQTVLGSCVSVCLWDSNLKVGGMNHFVLPEPVNNTQNTAYYGTESIRALVTGLLKLGSEFPHVSAKIFGGGKVVKPSIHHLDVGRYNIMVARDILGDYGIPVTNEFSGKDFGIKVMFYPATGKAFVKRLSGNG